MDDRKRYWLADRPLDSEFVRLEQQAALFDPTMRMRLSVLGLRAGMRCLEVGPGTGSMVRWLVEQGVTVTALDLSDRFFDHYAAPEVIQQVGDVRTAPLGDAFDFVVAQQLLHHVPERRAVIGRLAKSLRPGGWLVVNEPDVRLMWTHAGPEGPMTWFQEMLPRFVELGTDYSCGMEIPFMLRDASLTNVDAGVWTPVNAPGFAVRQLYLDVVEMLRPIFVERGWCADADLDAVATELADDSLIASGTPMVCCWGQRPPNSEATGDRQ